MSMGIINSLGISRIEVLQIISINFSIIFSTYILELLLQKYGAKKTIVFYEKIENILPENRTELLNDLEKRTGLVIKKIKINKYNFLRDTVEINIYS